MKYKAMLAISSMVVAGGALPVAAGAQQVPGPHPAYIHALTDLWKARHYLNDGWAWAPAKADDNAAIREIEAAINNIRQRLLTTVKD